ncbi:MAG TPA: PIG-L deacetylase family protein [Geobacteraceae bacterium]|nr:PIG-L deacetylase family protein [Geobacteraceae bacterium]
MHDKVLVVAPHPDDETLGCGGTLLKHKNDGDQIFWLITTNIHTENGWPAALVEQSQREIRRVAEMYGFTGTNQLDFAAAGLDAVPYKEVIVTISDLIGEIQPSVVYIPNRSDIHTDHQVTFNAVMSCCKDFRAPFIKRILMYECLSETEFSPALHESAFVPNVIVDISEHLQAKLNILKVYASEILALPFPRSIETVTSLARYRGSRIGKEYAEAFCLLFEKVL